MTRKLTSPGICDLFPAGRYPGILSDSYNTDLVVGVIAKVVEIYAGPTTHHLCCTGHRQCSQAEM